MKQKYYIARPPKEMLAPKIPQPVRDMESIQRLLVAYRLNLPPKGGAETFFKNHELPLKGFWWPEFTLASNIIKKTSIGALRIIFGSWLRYLIPLIIFFPKKQKRNLIIQILDNFTQLTQEVVRVCQGYRPVIRLCDSGREIYRAGTEFINTCDFLDTNELKRMADHFLLAVVMVWDADNAYRFRVQKAVTFLDEDKLDKNPGKELKRVLYLLADQEHAGEPIQEKIRLFGKLFRLLGFLKGFKRSVREINDIIDWNKIKPDESDNYWMNY